MPGGIVLIVRSDAVRVEAILEEQPDVIVTDAVTHIVEQFSLLDVGPDEIEWMWEARR